MIRKIAALGFCALLVVGCGRDEADSASTAESADMSQGTGQTDGSNVLFQRIDADTPWLMANLEAMPEDLSEKLWAPLQSMADMNRETYTKVANELDNAPVVAAVLREFAQIDSREAFAERGLEPNGYWAFHGVSLYPFVHWELSDPAAFRATIERIAADAEAELNWRDIEDAEVLWAEVEEAELGMALSYDDRFVSIAFIPDNDTLLRRVANLEQPAGTYDPSDLAGFSDERGYLPFGTGFVEFQHVVDELLEGDDAMIAAARESSGMGEIAGSEACRSELDALVDLFPRASMGYTEISETFMAFDATVESDPDFATRMQALTDTPVNLDDSSASLLDFGLALNIVGARDFAREIVGSWVENPPQCQLFDDIREKAEDWQLALNQPIPPVVTNFHGLRLNLQSVELGEGSKVESAEGTLALFMRNPQMMLGMAQMFSPELAAMQLEPGGDPQPVPKGVIPNLPANIPAFVGLGNAALGLAVGDAQKGQLNSAMEPGDGGSAILSYGINFEGYADAMEGLMAGMQGQLDGMDEESQTADPAEAMRAMAELYEYTRASMHLTERGIEFRSTMTLKD